jgi:NADPH:quinone reductase-like Zn-dependent oxidoreductase
MFVSKEHHSFIDRLAEFLAAGVVVPSIGSRFPLDRAAEAVRQLAEGGASGKTVISVVD